MILTAETANLMPGPFTAAVFIDNSIVAGLEKSGFIDKVVKEKLSLDRSLRYSEHIVKAVSACPNVITRVIRNGDSLAQESHWDKATPEQRIEAVWNPSRGFSSTGCTPCKPRCRSRRVTAFSPSSAVARSERAGLSEMPLSAD